MVIGKKRIFALLLSILLTVQLCWVLPVSLHSSAQDSDILVDQDFSNYTLVENETHHDMWNANSVTIKEDGSAKGGKYLEFQFGYLNSSWKSIHMSAVLLSGSAANQVKFAKDTAYTVKMRYKISNYSGNILGVGLSQTKGNTGRIDSQLYENPNQTYVLKSNLSDTDGWVENEFVITTSSKEQTGNISLYFFELDKFNFSVLPSNTFTWSVDYIKITEGSVEENVPDEEIEGETTEFTPQHMVIDFEKYIIPGSGMGSVYNSATLHYTIENDAQSGKYLKAEKTNKTNWTPAYSLLLNPSGKVGVAHNANNSYKMENGVTYRLSFKYKLKYTDTNSAPMIPVALGYSTNNNDTNAANYIWYGKSDMNAVYAVSNGSDYRLAPTEEWKVFTYDFTMNNIADYSGKGNYITPYLCLGAGGSWNAQQNAKYELCIDDIVMDRLAVLTLSSGANSRTKMKGVPACEAREGSIFTVFSGDVYDFATSETENYIANEYEKSGKKYTAYTALVGETKWYKDIERTQEVGEKYIFSGKNETIYSSVKSKYETAGQLAFCGFDEYYLRTYSNSGWNNYGSTGWNIDDTDSWQITDAESYTGSKSIYTVFYPWNHEKYNYYNTFLYIGSGYEFVPGQSYEISFWVKRDRSYADDKGDVTASIAAGEDIYNNTRGTTVTLPNSFEWTNVKFTWTANDGGKGRTAPVLALYGNGTAGYYFDTISITSICSTAYINDENYPEDFRKDQGKFNGFESSAEYKNGTSSFISNRNNTEMLLWYDMDGKPAAITLSDNTVYQMSFWYKSGGGQTIRFVTSKEGYTGDGVVVQGSYTTTNTNGGWNRAFLTFNVAANDGARALYLTVSGSGRLNIDDIKLTTSTIVKVDTMGGNRVADLYGAPGSAVALPAVTKEGKQLYGWYYDRALTKKCGNLVYPTDAESITIYARWVDKVPCAIVDFEAPPYETWSNGDKMSYTKSLMKFITNDVHGDSRAMRFHYYPGVTTANGKTVIKNTSEYCAFAMYNNAGSPVVLSNGRTYKVTFWFKAEKLGCNVSVFAMTSHSQNYWTYRCRNEYTDNAYTISYGNEGGEWTKAEFYFTADLLKYDDPKWGLQNGNSMFLWVKPLMDAEISILFDDIIVEEVEKNTTVYTYMLNNGKNPVYKAGTVGSAIKHPPSPIRNNYTFTGWYTDAECKKVFDRDTFGDTGMKIYAGWRANNVVIIDFEDEYYRASLNKNQLGNASIATNFGKNSKTSMYVNKAGKFGNSMHWCYAVGVAGEMPFTIENGATYVVTYDYYVIKNKQATNYSDTPRPFVRLANTQNGWVNWWRPETGYWPMGSSEKTNTWLTASYSFTAQCAAPDANGFYFTVDASQDFVGYFDNIRIEKVNKGNNSLLFLNSAGSDNMLDKSYLLGKSGSSVKLPVNLKKSGYTFIGWFKDYRLTKQIENNEFTFVATDSTVYAGWANNTLKQDFENYSDFASGDSYNYIDFDYEIYNANAKGSSKSNVHSGSYSIHRKGNDLHNCAFQIFNAAESISNILSTGKVYEISMWVKLENAGQPNGAVRIACSNSATYAWQISGDWKAVCALSDLKKDKWTKITYTFYATAPYLSISTPGYANTYIDDITVTLKPDLSAGDCSKEVEYTPYVIGESGLDAAFSIDTSLIKSTGLMSGGTNGNVDAADSNVILIIAFVAFAVVILGAVAFGIIFFAKKEKKRGREIR